MVAHICHSFSNKLKGWLVRTNNFITVHYYNYYRKTLPQQFKCAQNKYLVRCTYLVYCLVRAKRYPSPQQQNC